jgi:hypothetical protein
MTIEYSKLAITIEDPYCTTNVSARDESVSIATSGCYFSFCHPSREDGHLKYGI